MLFDDEVEKYKRDGLVVPRFRFSPQTVEDMKRDLSLYLPEDPTMTPDLEKYLMESTNFAIRYGSHPEIVRILKKLIGEDIILWACSLFGKPAKVGKETPWHQDGFYWPIKPLAACTVWIALDPSRKENGCLRFIPGSQKTKIIYSHENFSARNDITIKGVVKKNGWSETEAKNVELESGQMSIHDAYLVHGSKPNSSIFRRAGISLRYMPTTSYYDHEASNEKLLNPGTSPIKRRLHLVCGTDRSGKNIFPKI